MLTTKYVRDNIVAIRASLKKRKSDYPIDKLLSLDEESRKLKTELQQLQALKNKGSLEIAAEAKNGKNDQGSGEKIKEKSEELSKIKEKIAELEARLPSYEQEIEMLLWNLPNILHDSVPYGEDDSGNLEVKRVGNARKRRIPDHEEILAGMGLLDISQAAKVAGARFFYLKGDLALLEQALIHFAINELSKKGYTLIAPPLMMRKDYYKGVTALGDFEDALYKVEEDYESEEKSMQKSGKGLFLISTSEHAIAAMHAETIFSPKDLPKRYIGISPSFRREAGSHGKDTKGIFRTHQFYKVEQFVFSKKEDSWNIINELLSNSEEFFQKLGLPYRVVNICTGDIGVVAAKKFDIEAYMPSQDTYREVVSCSNCTDWQSLRLDIRYDEGGERKYVHTLNSTAIATNRALVAIVENYYKDNGTIEVPEVLQEYMGKKLIVGVSKK
jgi:seryl-tRNA synthetase